jgi:hypothetical protein
LLGHGAAEKVDFRPDGLRVRRGSFETDRHPRSAAVVAKSAGSTPKIIHDEIQISVIIEISEGYAMMHPWRSGSPLFCNICKLEVPKIVESDNRCIEVRVKTAAETSIPE